MNNGVIFEEGDKIRLGIRIGRWPEFARPVLSVQSENEIIKVASFTNDEGAELFANALIQVYEYAREIERKARPRGRWEERSCEDAKGKSGEHTIATARCSKCGLWCEQVRDWTGRVEYEYCPHCGADMRGDCEE